MENNRENSRKMEKVGRIRKEMAAKRAVDCVVLPVAGGCSFVKVRNNLFRVECIKSVRIEGSSLKLFLMEQMYAKVEFDSPEKAYECWEGIKKSLTPYPSPKERGVDGRSWWSWLFGKKGGAR